MTLESQVTEAKSLIKSLISKVKELELEKADANKSYDELAYVNETNLKRFEEIESNFKAQIEEKDAELAKVKEEIEDLKKTEAALRELLEKSTERATYFEDLWSKQQNSEEKPKKHSSMHSYVFGKTDKNTAEQFKKFVEHLLPEDYGYCQYTPQVAAVQAGISVEACELFTKALINTQLEGDPLVSIIKNRYYANFSKAKIIEYLFTEVE